MSSRQNQSAVSRRSFLRYASLAAAGNAAGLRPFGMLNALASTAAPTDYKALVCVFLYGGNDSNNTIIPFDTNGYANYASTEAILQESHSAHGQLHPDTSLSLTVTLTITVTI